ncbi:unnamed protein product [Rangifer tarandus platyrhynchus]|uniref:Uncharacterized protein n=1 Tax=Rangifer tarandus platyrhynchus TaxID=3082113 RepID=A0AC59YDQ8_RANTA
MRPGANRPPVGGVCPFASGRPPAPTTPASPAHHVSPGALSAPEGGSLASGVFDLKGPVPTGQFSRSGGRILTRARHCCAASAREPGAPHGVKWKSQFPQFLEPVPAPQKAALPAGRVPAAGRSVQ